MSSLYEQYQKGFHQEVYDELLAMQEHIDESYLYNEALLIMREIMRRVRYNIDLLILHLRDMGYLFGKGSFWEERSSEEKTSLERAYPIFQSPTAETLKQLTVLEQLVGPLPLSLTCWYEEVGSINLIGLFPSSHDQPMNRAYGSILDPLVVYSVEMLLKMIALPIQMGDWAEEPLLPLSPDRFHKYGFSGSGPYHMTLPCKTVDAFLFDEPHHTTFVNYLRHCLRWGGFPGLEQDCRLSSHELEYVTKDLLLF